MEIGEFHHTGGWYFKRLEDGSVRIRIRNSSETGAIFADRVEYIDHIVPPNEWASIVASVSAFDGAVSYGAATRLHAGQYEPVPGPKVDVVRDGRLIGKQG